MAKQTVDLGDGPDIGISDNLYEGFTKVNENTDELYSRVENLELKESSVVFELTIDSNTLFANLTPINTTYDSYIITNTEDLDPLNTDPLWVQGVLPTQIELPDWNSYTYYLWLLDNTTVTEVLTSDGSSGVTVTPTRTTETPDDVTFIDVENAQLTFVVTSNAVTISGLLAQTSISITNGEYSINSGTFTNADGVISNTDTVTLRQLSSGSVVTTTTVTVILGDRTETWNVTTISDIFLQSFTATVDIDTTTADLTWGYQGATPPVEWIIKEDDTSFPAVDDGDWDDTGEPETFALSDNNSHTLTARVKDADDNISNAITVTVTPTTSASPTITSFTTLNPTAGSQAYLFSLAATGTITHYMITDNDLDQPAEGDGGWVAWAGDYTDEAATLDALVDTTVRAYVKNDGTSPDDISAAAASFVDTSVSGIDTAPNGDYLWVNDPSISATNLGRTYSGSGSLTLDGTSGGLDALVDTTGDDDNHSVTIAGTYTAVTIQNFDFQGSNYGHIYINRGGSPGSPIDVTIRNCKFGPSNVNASAPNLFKSAISLYQVNNSDVDILGNWFDDPDSVMTFENCDSIALRVRHNFVSDTHARNTTVNWLQRGINFIISRAGSCTGDISENIMYNPTGTAQMQDYFNIADPRGSIGTPFDITRNRIWYPSSTSSTEAVFQISDGTASTYIDMNENTMIDANTFLQFSSGRGHLFRNNKGYTSEAFPAVGSGYIVQVYRYSIDPGGLYECEFSNNTFLHNYDDGSGNLTPLRDGTGYFYPSYGRNEDGSQGPWNHGLSSESPITGFTTTNDWNHSDWANGVGKSELWRASWTQFSYAGADGLTPTINYDSPWSGDGGDQDFTARSVTSAAYGDGAAINSIQQHDLIALVSGGVAPYEITFVNNKSGGITVTINPDGQAVIWTEDDTAGVFTYNYTVTDSEGSTATGTISGTTVDSSPATSLHYDQNDEDYICIDVVDPHEYYARTWGDPPLLAEWEARPGSGSPNNTYMQCTPYSGNIASDDVETDSCELVYRLHFDADGTYTVHVCGMALESSSYSEVWVGFNDEVDLNYIKVTVGTDPITSADWYWDDGTADGSAVQIIDPASGDTNYNLHVWKKRGGFALGKIVVTKGAEPTGAGPAISPQAPF